MRFYAVEITDPNTGVARLRYSTLNGDGSNNPKALRVYFDIPQFNAASPAGLAMIRLYGVTFQDLKQSNLLVDLNIVVYGGMGYWLPLSNPKQAGVLLRGTIYQAYGNWQGNEITLDLVVAPYFDGNTTPVNLSFIWKQGETLDSMVRRTLTQAFPDPAPMFYGSFSASGLSPASTLSGTYTDLRSFSQYVEEVSHVLKPSPTYAGAQIAPVPNGFCLSDYTGQSVPVQLSFTDFIGNATYQTNSTINFKLQMRGDLTVGQVITMPPLSNIANTQNTFTQYRDNISFQNNFEIFRIRHLGDSRQSTADSWVTVIDAFILGTRQ